MACVSLNLELAPLTLVGPLITAEILYIKGIAQPSKQLLSPTNTLTTEQDTSWATGARF